MREQESRLLHDAREPELLQVARRDVPEQHRDLPDLHQLVGKPESPRAISSEMRAKVCTSCAGSSGTPPNSSGTPECGSDLVGLLEDSARQARIRVHQPLALPVSGG